MMEKENFDEELKNRIKQVFEEYDDEAADKGWELLREKCPEKKRRDYFFWWFSSAAALFLIAFIFWLYQPDFYQNKVVKAAKPKVTDTVTVLSDHFSSTKKTVPDKILSDSVGTKKTWLKTASGLIAKQLSAKNNFVKGGFYADSVYAKKTWVKTASGVIAKQELDSDKSAEFASGKQLLQPKIETEDQKIRLHSKTKKEKKKI